VTHPTWSLVSAKYTQRESKTLAQKLAGLHVLLISSSSSRSMLDWMLNFVNTPWCFLSQKLSFCDKLCILSHQRKTAGASRLGFYCQWEPRPPCTPPRRALCCGRGSFLVSTQESLLYPYAISLQLHLVQDNGGAVNYAFAQWLLCYQFFHSGYTVLEHDGVSVSSWFVVWIDRVWGVKFFYICYADLVVAAREE
jgi:hypothetical protein